MAGREETKPGIAREPATQTALEWDGLARRSPGGESYSPYRARGSETITDMTLWPTLVTGVAGIADTGRTAD